MVGVKVCEALYDDLHIRCICMREALDSKETREATNPKNERCYKQNVVRRLYCEAQERKYTFFEKGAK